MVRGARDRGRPEFENPKEQHHPGCENADPIEAAPTLGWQPQKLRRGPASGLGAEQRTAIWPAKDLSTPQEVAWSGSSHGIGAARLTRA